MHGRSHGSVSQGCLDLIEVWGGDRAFSQSVRTLMHVLEQQFGRTRASGGYDFGDELEQLGNVMEGTYPVSAVCEV
eukprot:m.1508029 g.1508029  ORF g.1508029 m.1508029 type:complete len:76 (-) comp25209_c0_seq139:4791-5018(-)